jgi:hypothetical protein
MSSVNNNNNNNEDQIREVESRFVQVYDLHNQIAILDQQIKDLQNELLQTPIRNTNLSTTDSQTIERRINEKVDARDSCSRAIQSIMREMAGAYSSKKTDSVTTPSVITNQIVPMEKVVKLERLDEENLKKWQEFLADLKIVNNPAERNKYIHFELAKVLVHWFSAQNYPEAEKWFI